VNVTDGDTIKIRVAGKVDIVRLIGIDAPETGSGRTTVECFGREATNYLRTLLTGKTVRLATDPSQDERDRYDRLLAYVWLDDGTFVNEVLVADGYAHEYTYDAPYKYRDRFRAAEVEARSGERGLWASSACAATAPPSVGGAPVAPPAPAPAVGLVGQVAPTSVPNVGVSDVVIARIDYDGDVPDVESDEHVVITNNGQAPVGLAGWRLNAGNPGQDFVFLDVTIAPGESCHIYTNQAGTESCNFSFRSGKAIWNNKGDCGRLFDASGAEVSTFCY
jgi:micrococcal nuclease